MNRFIASFFLAAAVPLMAPLPAFADPFCDTLKAIVAAGNETTAFDSLTTHTPNAAGRMTGSVAFAGFACTVDPDKARTFYSCKAVTTNDGAARQVDLAKQAGACLSRPVQSGTASMGDVLSSLVIDGKRQTTVAVRWSASFNELTINTIATIAPATAVPPAPADKLPSPKECLVVAFEAGWGASTSAKGAGAPLREKGRPSRDDCIRAGYWVKIPSDGSQPDAARLTKFAQAIQQERKAQQDREDLATKCFILDASGADKKELAKQGC
jgi:hypothetical protein